MTSYYDKKNALVVRDPVNAKDEAKQVEKKASLTMKAIVVDARHIQVTDELVFLREHFELVFDSIYKELDMSNLYRQHCPMADSNQGADWLSREEEIINPYFGEDMLSCGEVKSVIP